MTVHSEPGNGIGKVHLPIFQKHNALRVVNTFLLNLETSNNQKQKKQNPTTVTY